jgi:hypothetical protein
MTPKIARELLTSRVSTSKDISGWNNDQGNTMVTKIKSCSYTPVEPSAQFVKTSMIPIHL